MRKRHSIILFAVMAALMFSSGCRDYVKFNEMDSLEKQVEFFNRYSQEFSDIANLFLENSNLITVTVNENWLGNQTGFIKNVGGIYIKSTIKYDDEKINEIIERTKDLISFNAVEGVSRREDRYIEFSYASFLAGVSWIYATDGKEPDKKELYITQMEKIDDHWYAVLIEGL